MDQNRWRKIQEIFLTARQLDSSEQQQYLTRACGPDEELHAELSTLLEADLTGEAVDRLADNWLSPLAEGEEKPSLVGQQVGPYLVTEHLGQGGMARVYLAERHDGQFQQKVAIKVLRRGQQEMLQRFSSERDILARLSHPNIARLLDGGTLPDDSPYLVMEYVDGQPIDLWADEGAPSPRDIVRLFLQICEAVQYAHRNLVVHRDLKPSNILVDSSGHVRLLDFGIAKLLAQDAPDLTRPFALVLTPQYSSPEQIKGGAVTTATDVYTMGLVLFRLLGGKVAQPMTGKTDQEMRRLVCEAEIPLVSKATDQASRARVLRGDLDTIVARALAKDPVRRYDSPTGLADDLRRWLDGKPVLAQPDRFRYRAGKFVKRNRVAVVSATITLLALLVGLGGTYWQAQQAGRERDLAQQSAQRSDQVTRFMVNLFEAADPMLASGDTLTARQLLDRGHLQIEGSLQDQPLVRASMLHAMGEAYLNLGLYPQADSLLSETQNLIANSQPVDSLKVALVQESLGRLRDAQGDWELACQRFRGALQVRRRHLSAGDPLIAKAWNNLGSSLMGLGLPDSAAGCFNHAIAMHENGGADSRQDLAVALTNMASSRSVTGRRAEAIALFSRADSLLVLESGPEQNSPQRANLLTNWGLENYRQGDLKGAETRLQASLKMWRQVVDSDHPQVGRGENNLAAILEKQGLNLEAEPHYRESLRIKRKTMGPRHPSVANTCNNLALLMQKLDNFAESEELLNESLSIREETLPADHPHLARGWYNLARLYHDTDRPALAEPLYLKAIELRARVLGPENQETVWAARSLIRLLGDQGRKAEADALEALYPEPESSE